MLVRTLGEPAALAGDEIRSNWLYSIRVFDAGVRILERKSMTLASFVGYNSTNDVEDGPSSAVGFVDAERKENDALP